MTGKRCAFSAQKAGKGSLFSEASAGISTSTQWMPCYADYGLLSLVSSFFIFFNLQRNQKNEESDGEDVKDDDEKHGVAQLLNGMLNNFLDLYSLSPLLHSLPCIQPWSNCCKSLL